MGKIVKKWKLGEWMDRWLSVYAEPNLSIETMKIYYDAMRRLAVLFPEVNSCLLEDIMPLDVQLMFSHLAKKYAKSTIQHIKTVYGKAYDAAMRNELCEHNPFAECKVPANATVKTVNPMTGEEQNAFENALQYLPVLDAFLLRFFLYTGLRRAELINLKWADWDKKQNVIQIRKSKTPKGIRQVPIIPEGTMILCYLEYRQRSSAIHTPYVFCDANGEPVSKYHIRHICSKVSKLAQIPHVTPHILRHTCATRLIENGADAKSVAEILGHANVAFTLQRYVKTDARHLAMQMRLLSGVGKGEPCVPKQRASAVAEGTGGIPGCENPGLMI